MTTPVYQHSNGPDSGCQNLGAFSALCSVCGFAMSFVPDIEAGRHAACAEEVAR